MTDAPPSEPGTPTPAPRRPSRWDRPKHPRDWRWVVSGIGRGLITIGLLLFAFVGYQLWGTGIQTAQAQRRLSDQFDQQLASTTTVTTVAPTTTVVSPTTTGPAATTTTVAPTTTIPAPLITAPALGEPVARLDIPTIGIDGKIVIEGVRPSDLADGPGHFPETPLPGQFGNAAIAGHRTTHGQPFYRIDELQPGDDIVITTLAGRYVYVVTGQLIVGPDDYDLIIPTVDATKATLTLTSCHPRWSTRQRIVVQAEIDLERSDLVTAAAANLAPPTGGLPTESTPAPSDPPTSGAPPASVPDTHAAPATDPDPDPIGTEPDPNPGSAGTEPDPVGTGPAGTSPAGTSPAGTSPTSTGPTSTGPTSTVAPPSSGAGEDAFANRWFADGAAWPHVIGWGLLLVAIWWGSYELARHKRRVWVGLVVGVAPFLVTLYFFFENVSRLLPPNL